MKMMEEGVDSAVEGEPLAELKSVLEMICVKMNLGLGLRRRGQAQERIRRG